MSQMMMLSRDPESLGKTRKMGSMAEVAAFQKKFQKKLRLASFRGK